ncbi:hypothetical protein VB796_16195 [Arcicella sp. LKC2W]|uniref:hypothetical protein n=1 Tax=Arcicella sp. LKC2W TaxID=2984198 RepID=UPI002B220B84|nr:hypothetical protein [Arcicella sp. LKC2W]MEA5460598.1 hypothetical protein [Arcicella sp. LKC2W]
MTATYQIQPHELNQFIESLRKSFKGRSLKIVVEEIDETTYLLSENVRAERLKKAANNVRTNTNVKSLTFDELDELEKRATI